MRIKFLAIYILAGVAFLAVSLWVLLSKGRSAKAVNAKFKLGGIMLTALSMISAASCTGTPVVTCYEPVEPEVMCYDVAVEADLVSISVKGYEGFRLKSGDVLLIKIQYPTYSKYLCRIKEAGEGGALIQEQTFDRAESDPAEFELTLAPTEYKGDAEVAIYGADGGEDMLSRSLIVIF